MEANLSNSINAVLFVTNLDKIPLITQNVIREIFPDLLVVEQEDQLVTSLQDDTVHTLIILDKSLSDPIKEQLKNRINSNLTIFHITDQPSNLGGLVDFILQPDDQLDLYLRQIISFQQQQVSRNNALETRVIELEAQLNNEKQHSNQIEILKEAIVRNVSHELKTPLLHVKSAVSLMAEDVGKENKLIRYAENATARLETLVTNITMFGSSLDLNLGPVIVRDTIEYAHRNLRRIWESKEQAKRIQFHIDSDLPPVLADRQGLSTILQLLLDNALKFSEKDIEVHAHRIDNEVELAVKDYGIGIDPDDVTNIFDSFYQVDHSSTRRYGGTGVGLALVKLLLEKHKSKITVDSQIGEGSTFSFRLTVIKFNSD